MVGDFLSGIHEIEPMIKGYALQGITGHIVQICDPAEESLPLPAGRFEGLEEGSALIGRADAVREDYNPFGAPIAVSWPICAGPRDGR